MITIRLPTPSHVVGGVNRHLVKYNLCCEGLVFTLSLVEEGVGPVPVQQIDTGTRIYSYHTYEVQQYEV